MARVYLNPKLTRWSFYVNTTTVTLAPAKTVEKNIQRWISKSKSDSFVSRPIKEIVARYFESLTSQSAGQPTDGSANQSAQPSERMKRSASRQTTGAPSEQRPTAKCSKYRSEFGFVHKFPLFWRWLISSPFFLGSFMSDQC